MQDGYRLLVCNKNYDGNHAIKHFSGYLPQFQMTSVDCINCSNKMFPAINLDFSDQRLSCLDIWENDYLHILFCPFCAFYMEPYWLCYENNMIKVIGGYTKSSEVLQNIETPYIVREIELRKLSDADDPTIESILDSYYRRTKDEGVYHQIGGMPICDDNKAMECCKCRKPMVFAGILDYDDLNIPLYEDDHRPVSLIIGDYDSMYFYTCIECSVIGLRWIK